MNTNHLSVDEIVSYVNSGVITEMSGEDFLRVVEKLLLENEIMFDEGHKAGYSEAVQDYQDREVD